MDDHNMDFTEEELAALRELEAARKAQEAEDDHTLPELEEDGESGLTFPEDYAHMTDEEVVRLCQHSDSVAQEYLFNKYKNFVRSKARSYFLIGADHEDIVQEGMIGLYKAIRDYKPDKLSSFRAFAELCITRQIITAIKTATRQKHIPLNSYVSLNKPLYDEESDRTLLDVIIEGAPPIPRSSSSARRIFPPFTPRLTRCSPAWSRRCSAPTWTAKAIRRLRITWAAM